MFDENEERPESLRMKKLKELVEELSLMVNAPEESEEPPAMPEPDGDEMGGMPMPKEKPQF